MNTRKQIRHLIFIFIAIVCAFTQVLRADAKSNKPIQFDDLSIRISGTGQDLIFVPGLNSRSEVFTDLCEQLKQSLSEGVRCQLVQLPGFAGATPMNNVDHGFLAPMSDQLTRYIQSQNLNKPILVGHSLGGFLSLMIASKQPDLLNKLVIIDSLPYLAAVQNPAATVEQMQPIAKAMKQSMLSVSDQQFKQRIPMQLMGMSRNQERMPTLIEWSETTDRATMAQAMYDMQTLDLRQDIAAIKTPAIIFSAWAAYESYGTTKQLTEMMIASQYQQLANKTIHISDRSYHFIMWDDAEWLVQHIGDFLNNQ